MIRGFTWIGGLCLFLLSGGCKQQETEPPLSYDGSATIGEAILPELITGYERISGRRFGVVSMNGSTEGFEAVMAGRVALAGMIRSLKSTEKARDPYYEIIGYDALSIFVHASNPLTGLSRQQLKDIFTGKVTRWSEVGGPDLPIEPVTEQAQHHERGTRQSFQELVLESAPFTRTHELDFPGDCVRYVAGRPGAVTYASFVFTEPGVKVLPLDGVMPSLGTIRTSEYALTRPLLLVSREVPRGQALLFFKHVLSPEGQTVVKKHFVGRAEVD